MFFLYVLKPYDSCLFPYFAKKELLLIKIYQIDYFSIYYKQKYLIKFKKYWYKYQSMNLSGVMIIIWL